MPIQKEFQKKIQIEVPSYMDETRRNIDEGAFDNDNTTLLLDEMVGFTWIKARPTTMTQHQTTMTLCSTTITILSYRMNGSRNMNEGVLDNNNTPLLQYERAPSTWVTCQETSMHMRRCMKESATVTARVTQFSIHMR